MKNLSLSLCFLCIFFCVFLISAKTKYVTDSFEITLRTEPNGRSRVVAMPKSGTRLEALDKSGDWTHVKLKNGKVKEGWVLTRYLESKTPSALSLKYVQKKYDESKEKLKEKKRESRELRGIIDSISKDIKNTSWKLKNTESSYEDLKKGSTDYLSLKANYDSTLVELNNSTTVIQALTAANERLRNDEKKKWFLIGASIIALGFLVGLYYGSKNKKKRY